MANKRKGISIGLRWAGLCGLLGLQILLGCLGEKVAGGTGVGNPPQGIATFSMLATSSQTPLGKIAVGSVKNPDGSFTVTDSGGTVFIIKKSLANVENIKFKLPDGITCDASLPTCETDEIELPGPFASDLMTGSFGPDTVTFKVPAGLYRTIKIKMEALAAGSPPTDSVLQGHSLILSGSFNYAGKPDRAFSITVDIEEEAEFASDTGFTVEAEGINKITLLLNVDRWLTNANLTRCLDQGLLKLDTLGNLNIDKDNACPGLTDTIKEGIKASGDVEELTH